MQNVMLIYMAVAFQLFICIDYFIGNAYLYYYLQGAESILKEVRANSFFYFGLTFLLGSVCGAFVIAKFANKINFLKLMRIISEVYVLVTFLAFLFSLSSLNHFKLQEGSYFITFCYAFLMPASLILPSFYLFTVNPLVQHIKVSTKLTFIIVSVGLFAYLFSYFFIKFWYLVPFGASICSFFCYRYLENFFPSVDLAEPENEILSTSQRIFAFLLGSAFSTYLVHHDQFFLSHITEYMFAKSLVDKYSEFIYFLPFWVLILPGARSYKNFGTLPTLHFSLASLFILIVYGIFVNDIGTTIYVIHQVLFSFSAALFAIPCLAILYELFKRAKNNLNIISWFTAGFSFSVFFSLARSKIEIYFQFLDASVYLFFIINIICLLGLFAYNFFEKKQKVLSEDLLTIH